MNKTTDKGLKLAGVFLFTLGLSIIFFPKSPSITGYIISENSGIDFLGLLGGICFITGMLLFFVRPKRKKKTIKEIINEARADSPID